MSKKKKKHNKAHRAKKPQCRQGGVVHATNQKPKSPYWAKKESISLCMIVQDEEKRLPTALNSVLGFVDEVIIVDNGSTDNTLNILKEAQRNYKKKVGGRFIILSMDWTGKKFHFSKSRNYGISHAQGDYIFQLDADEEVKAGEGQLLRQCAQKMSSGDLQDSGVIFFNLHNVLQNGEQTQIPHSHLFRRVGVQTGALFQFEGHMHNRPIYEGTAARCPMTIYHYGYGDDPQTMMKKHIRRRGMLQDWLEREPDGFLPNYYMGQSLCSEVGPEAEDAALEHSQKALDAFHNRSKESQLPEGGSARCYYSMLLIYLKRDDPEKALGVVEKSLKELPWYPDPLFFKAWAHMELGQWKECCRACVDFLDVQEQAQTDPEVQKLFVGVENMTIGKAGGMAQFWRTAAKHCLGCADDSCVATKPSVVAGVAAPVGQNVTPSLGSIQVQKDGPDLLKTG